VASCNLCGTVVQSWQDCPEGPVKCPTCRSVGRHRAVGKLFEIVAPRRADLVFDLGGDGVMCSAYSRRMISVDISYDGATVHGNLGHLPIRTGTTTLALCLDVLEHVRDDVKAVRELKRVMAPGGSAFVTASCWALHGPSKTPPDAGLAEWHLDMAGEWASRCFRYYTDESLLRLLADRHFDVERVVYTDHALAIYDVVMFVLRKPAAGAHK